MMIRVSKKTRFRLKKLRAKVSGGKCESNEGEGDNVGLGGSDGDRHVDGDGVNMGENRY